MLSQEAIQQFHRDGYIIERGLFDAEEMHVLRESAKNDRALEQNTHGLADGEGGVQRLSLWYRAGDDVYSLVARSHRVVDRMEALLGTEVYHYHSKMSIKEPFTGGAWAWHQDYGYWYNMGYMFPDMASCFVAVDPNTRENGCMQVLRGSHRLGRIEHGTFGDQTGADPERVAQAMRTLELVYVEMDPGDALFFHSNTLHRSDQNKSPDPRWSLICCYNAVDNLPFNEPAEAEIETRLQKAPDSALKEAGIRSFAGRADFWAPVK